MMRIQFVAARCLEIIALTISVATAMAQSSKLPNSADTSAAVPAVKYESAFSDYQPFREQKIRSWKEVNQEVADNPGMGSMGSMKDMPGMGSMGSMKDMPGMDSKAGNAPKSKEGNAGRNMGSMKDMPGMNKQAPGASMSKEGHGAMAMAKSNTGPGNGQTAGVTGTGVVQGIDRANGKVKLTHDPIEALGWPKMTMFFRLKDGTLADQLKEGDKVEFSLEKSATGYVISGFQKGAPSR